MYQKLDMKYVNRNYQKKMKTKSLLRKKI